MKKGLILSVLVGIFAVIPAAFASSVPFSAGSATENSVVLSWTTSPDLVSHEVRYSTSPITDTNFMSATDAGSMPVAAPSAPQSITVSGLSSGTRYYFAYRFLDTVGMEYTSYANIQTVTQAVNNPPAAVSGFSGSATASSITLSWTAPSDSDLSQYDVRYSLNPISTSNFNSASQVSGVPLPIANSSQVVVVSGLSANTQYYFAIKVFDTVGQASPIQSTTQTTSSGNGGGSGSGVLLPVTNLTATPGTSYIDFSWDTPNSNVLSMFDARYDVGPLSQATFTAGSMVNNAPLPIQGTRQSVRISGLKTGTTYGFGIRTVSTVGEVSSILFVSARTSDGSTGGGGGGNMTPPPVTNLTAARNSTNVLLSWDTPVSNILSMFEVGYSAAPINGTNFGSATKYVMLPLPLPGTRQSVTIPNVPENVTYYFSVRTVSTVGEPSSLAHTSVTATGSSQNVPPVTNLSATPSQNYIDLGWDTPVSNILSMFDVRCATTQLTASNFASGSMVNNAPLPIPGTHQGVRVSGLSAGTTYYCGIRDVSTVGEVSTIAFISGTTTGGGTNNNIGGGGGGGIGGNIATSGAAVAPEVGIVINNGAEKTDRTLVTLTLTATGATEMMLSERNDFPNAKWEPFAASTQWVLSAGNGTKTVYAKFKNTSGAVGNSVADSIILEIPSAPVIPQPPVIIRTPVVIPQVSYPYTTIISITPNAVYVPETDRVVVVLTAHPGEGTKYGAHLELEYPTDIMELDTIRYGDGWVPEFDPAYNFDNKESGKLIKTARYAEGFSEPTHFATLSFIIKKSGTGIFDTNSFSALRELPEYKDGGYITQTTATSFDGKGNSTRALFASLVSLDTQNNWIAIVSAFIFFFILYVAYVISMHKTGRRKFVYPLPLRNNKATK